MELGRLHGAHVGPWMQALHVLFGVGALLAPVAIGAFKGKLRARSHDQAPHGTGTPDGARRLFFKFANCNPPAAVPVQTLLQ